MNALHVDLARYYAEQDEYAAFDALVEFVQEEIAEETERLYTKLYEWERPMTEAAKQAIRDFSYKKAYFCVLRDKQEECMSQEYAKLIRVMHEDFAQHAKQAGMTVDEYEEYELATE